MSKISLLSSFSILFLVLSIIWVFSSDDANLEQDDFTSSRNNQIIEETQQKEINLPHWDHMPLTYTITDNADCEGLQINKMIEAFSILENRTSYIKFSQINGPDADISVRCIDVGEIKKDFQEEIERLKKEKLNCRELYYNYEKDSISTFEEGVLNSSEEIFVNASKHYIRDPKRTVWKVCYINISDVSSENIQNYGIEDWRDISRNILGDARPEIEEGIITKGQINLYKPKFGWSVCTDFPVKEVHELLHLFAFDHVEEPEWNPLIGYVDTEPTRDILFPYSDCTVQKTIQEKYTSCLDYIYSGGKVGSCSDEVNFLYSENGCPYGYFPTLNNDFCCPEEGMISSEGYCSYG